MSEPTPNDAQRRLIENTEGVYVVDAGAGTGKTFAITRRYASIVDREAIAPEDVLLVTFTRSAATEMKERIVDRSQYSLRALADAPIRTFHAHCHALLREHGHDAPTHLGIDDCITGSTRLVEDDLVEEQLFREFVGRFRDDHPAYADRFRALDDPLELLELVKRLAAKGVVPTAEGWYRDGREQLVGDVDAFREQFDAVNRPRNDGRKQSELRDALSRYGRNKTYLPDAPSKTALRGERGTKQVPDSVAGRAFDEDRDELIAFVHDVYFEYLSFALERNVLNFGFLQSITYVLLCEDAAVREHASFEYVMVDEFQDTSEIQFKLALLLSGSENLCAVGDWKQSIYSFQYADVGNITEFDERLTRYAGSLNDDAERVPFETPEVTTIELTENYRSTGRILNFSEEALLAPATEGEDVDDLLEDVVSLSSNVGQTETTIRAIQHAEEHEAVLSTIQDIVGNDDYAVRDDDGDLRPPEYGDVAVLTRTRAYGRDFLAVADDHGIPTAYDGGVELFRTDPAKLLLAWLRILESDVDRGWAVVLERAGYTIDEVDRVLSTGQYPQGMVDFRQTLDRRESVGTVARAVFDRYDCDGEYGDVILDTIQSVHDATTMTRGELIRFIERAIDSGATHEVQASTGADSVTVQTIHAAKGREYPIVVLANMNDGRFPPRTRNGAVITYEEPVGIRQRKRYAEVGKHPHVYDEWRADIIRHCLPEGYDEERRLLYVAITRAESHVVFAAGEEPNSFLEALPVPVESVDPSVDPVREQTSTQAQLPFTVATPDGPLGLTPHDLMDDAVFEEGEGEADQVEGRGRTFGSAVHDFAEAYASGDAVSPSNDDERHVREFLDGLEGDLFVEEPCVLPLDVDGRRVTVSGLVDLVHVRPEGVDVIDYKTDRSDRATAEYRKQLSVYHHVLQAAYPDREISASIYYTADGRRKPIQPVPLAELEDLVRNVVAVRGDR